MKWLQWLFLFLLGAINRNTPLGRILLVFPGVAICAWKGLLLHFGIGKDDALDIPSRWWGFCDPLLKWDTEGSFGHKATDYIVEWVRLRPQRAAKLGGLALWAAFIAGWLLG